MLIYIFLVSTFISFVAILQNFYFYFRFDKMLMIVQQSGYDKKRIFKHMSEASNDVFPPGDILILVAGLLISTDMYIFGFLILLFALYYSVRFFNIRKKRYDTKKPLVYTNRVKRLVFTFVIINAIIAFIMIFVFGIFSFIKYSFLVIGIINYLMLVFLNLAVIINQPIESHKKQAFINQAKVKLQKNTSTKVIGITGSYGKTSIKNIVGSILEQGAPTLITPESFNTPLGLTITINNHLNVFHEYFVAEMGAYYQGEIKELCDIVSPKVGIVSSVGPQHLETFKTIETILNTKMELIEALPCDGLGVLNYDNELIRSYDVKNPVAVKWFSYDDPKADIYASNVSYDNAILNFDINFKDQIIKVSTKLLGKHAVTNILCAVLVADFYGFDINTITQGINKLKPVKNRLEYKYVNPELSILDDAFNSNESGIKEAVNILGSFEGCKRIIITPGLLDLGSKQRDVHIALGKMFEENADIVYIVGEYNKEVILEGVKASNFDLNLVFCEDNFIEAYNKAVMVQGKKVILIANDFPDKFR